MPIRILPGQNMHGGIIFFFTSSLIVIWFQSITFSQVLGHEKVIKQWNVTNVILSVPGYRHGNPINTVNIFCSWSRYTLTSILVGFFYQLFNSIPRFPIKCVYNARTRNGFRETSISSVICSKKKLRLKSLGLNSQGCLWKKSFRFETRYDFCDLLLVLILRPVREIHSAKYSMKIFFLYFTMRWPSKRW